MKKKINFLLILLLVLIPYYGIGELYYFFDKKIPFDIVFFKLPKDILIVLILLLSWFSYIQRRIKQHIHIWYLCYFFWTAISFFLAMDDLTFALAGLRWTIPFFLAFFLVGKIDYSFLLKTTNILMIIILLTLFVQVYEMFFMPPKLGLNIFGLTGRVSGFFAFPSIAGTFGAFTFFFVTYFSDKTKRVKVFYLILCTLSIFLSMSSSGVGLLILLLLFPFWKKVKKEYRGIVFFLVVTISIGSLFNLDKLTGRDSGSSKDSFSTRVQIFYQQLELSESISTHFGEATNTAYSILSRDSDRVIREAFIADSLFTSLLVNYGSIFFIVNILLLFYVLYISIKNKQDSQILFVLIFILSSSIQIITEIFPVNILTSILAAYYLGRKP